MRHVKTSGENAGSKVVRRVINASEYSYFATGLILTWETVCRRIFVELNSDKCLSTYVIYTVVEEFYVTFIILVPSLLYLSTNTIIY